MASLRALTGVTARCAVIASTGGSKPAARRFLALTSSAGQRFDWNQRRGAQCFWRYCSTKADKASSKEDGVQRFEFQAETRQLLDIVAKSLYSEKEVFIREIVSNSSDALEKLRHLRLTEGGAEHALATELKVEITVNEADKTFIIQDNGIGMEREELIENLGTIARSGSQAFLKQLREKGESSASAAQSIIGHFGVGFYSTFMVGDIVTVYSRSWKPDSKGYRWMSDGSGMFELAEDTSAERGTKIVVQLNNDGVKFAARDTVKKIISKYSNFISFPIYLNGEQINKLQPLWMTQGRKITAEEHKEFFQFIAQGSDDPRYSFHYSADAPMQIRSLIYVPKNVSTMFGVTHEGLALYNRRVLIQDKARDILPEWLRFVKGVVDCEDIPLNLSREMLQNIGVIRSVRETLTSRIVKFLHREAKKAPESYNEFFSQCGVFIREGILANDPCESKNEIAKLLRFESSAKRPGVMTSLTEYVERMQENQNHIFFLCTTKRDFAQSSPYYLQLQEKGFEILLSYDPADDLVLNALEEFNKKKIRSAESFSAAGDEITDDLEDFNEDKPTSATEDSVEDLSTAPEKDDGGRKVRLSSQEAKELCDYIRTTLDKKVDAVKPTGKLANFPAVITSKHISMMRSMKKNAFAAQQFASIPLAELLRPTLEINPSHPVIMNLYQAYEHDRILAKLALEQLYDNALIAAGVVDDPRHMLDRLNQLLVHALERSTKTAKAEKTEEIVVPDEVEKTEEIEETEKREKTE